MPGENLCYSLYGIIGTRWAIKKDNNRLAVIITKTIPDCNKEGKILPNRPAASIIGGVGNKFYHIYPKPYKKGGAVR